MAQSTGFDESLIRSNPLYRETLWYLSSSTGGAAPVSIAAQLQSSPQQVLDAVTAA